MNNTGSTSPSQGTYQAIWHALAQNTQEKIVVRCPAGHMETLIQAVKKIKSTENANRKRIGAPHWGRLTVSKDEKAGTVSFGLTYAMENLV